MAIAHEKYYTMGKGIYGPGDDGVKCEKERLNVFFQTQYEHDVSRHNEAVNAQNLELKVTVEAFIETQAGGARRF